MSGWVSLQRKITEWEWFQDSNMTHLFLNLIIKANYKEKKWEGIVIKRGQLITSLRSLNEETGISIRSLRTCLNRLKISGEIDTHSDKRFTLITICNYDTYQDINNNSDTGNDNQTTTTNKYIYMSSIDTSKLIKGREVYESYLEKAETDLYKKFLTWLLHDEEFEQIFLMSGYLDENKFYKIYNLANKKHNLVKDKIMAMENRPDLLKTYRSFYLTLNNWVKRGINE